MALSFLRLPPGKRPRSFLTTAPIGTAEALAMALAVRLDQGRDLPAALQDLHVQGVMGVDTGLLGALARDVGQGTSFAEALARFPDICAPSFVQAVAVGEQHHTLDWACKAFAVAEGARSALARARLRLHRCLIGAVLATAAWLAVVGVITARMEPVFRDLGVHLRLITMILVICKRGVRHPPLSSLWLIAIILGMLVVILQRCLASAGRRRRVVLLLWRVPLLGPWWRRRTISGLSCELGTLMLCGLTLAQAASVMSAQPSAAVTQAALGHLVAASGPQDQPPAPTRDASAPPSPPGAFGNGEKALITAGWEQLLAGVLHAAGLGRRLTRIAAAVRLMTLALWTVGSGVAVIALLDPVLPGLLSTLPQGS